MRPRDAVRSAARYHLRAFVPTVVGVGLAGVGLWYGLRGGGTPLSVTALAASERAVPAALLVGVGLLVAVFGRTAARLTATADLVAVEVEDAQDDDGIDPDDLRETVSLAVQHAVADTMDVASDQIEKNVEDAVSRAIEERGESGTADPTRKVVDPTGEREVRDLDTQSASPDPSSESVDGDVPADGTLADPLAGRSRDDEEARDPLAEASRQASERMQSLLDGDDSEFPAEASPDAPAERDSTPESDVDERSSSARRTQSDDGAEILTDDGAGDEAAEQSQLPDGSTADDAEIIDGDRNAGASDEETERDADAGMVFGTDLKDAE
ncbi:hypothetical protein [Halopelagius longus]|uniref:Uncharacterized protein n=1 Tax=Halopelagius longus TaxID=1236180 RepID=A0A1H1AYW8_9EURY|nr:hypothetical protein [Halopelagius longus]RDI70571.1 hypothetical protein DWB78_01885 [Halopelagius longus]SDQ44895.1 hypothetical protein SAMN05216278_1556 [Halopelagius longus]